MRQVALIPAGCQPWFHHVVASTVLPQQQKNSATIGHGEPSSLAVTAEPPVARFAYCSTLAIYLYDYFPPQPLVITSSGSASSTNIFQRNLHGYFRLKSILAEFTSNVTALAWNPKDPYELAVALQADGISIYDIQHAHRVKDVIKTTGQVKWMEYSPFSPEVLAYQDDHKHIRFRVGKVMQSVSHDEEITTLQWHPKLSGKMILGDSYGGLFLLDVIPSGPGKLKLQKKKLDFSVDAALEDLVTTQSSTKEPNPVLDAKFDPHSDSYLLIAYKNGRLLLCDTSSCKVIAGFNRQSGKVATVQWIPHIPGGFLTADTRSGILRLWSVSQASPIQVIKVLSSPIHALLPLLPARVASTGTQAHPAIGNFYITAFTDGSLGVYNLSSLSFAYLRHGGHTETIFGCDAKGSMPAVGTVSPRDDQNFCLMATGSFDGTIKIWDLNNSTNLPVAQNVQTAATSNGMGSNDLSEGFRSALNGLWVGKNILGVHRLSADTANGTELGLNVTLLDSFPPLGSGRTNEDGVMETEYGIWYSVSWAPDSSYRLVSGSNRGHVVVYDAKKARIVANYQKFHTGAIYRVAWCQSTAGAGAGLVASCSADNYCYVFRPEDGTILKKYRHPDEAYGCDWNPLNSNLLATGCMDGRVQIFDVSASKDTPKYTFLGHSSRTFNIAWSPLVATWLATSSDDCDVRVWSLRQNTCLAILHGHGKRVRGIAWSPILPHILISGSWDNDIRIWNVSTATCLHIVSGHVADVYGICCIPAYPILFASTSRDNTMRLWSMEYLFSEIKWDVVAHMAIGEFEKAGKALYYEVTDGDGFSPDTKLSGPFAKQVYDLIVDVSVPVVQKWKAVMTLFAPLGATEELWNMIISCVTTEQKVGSSISCNATSLLLPKTELTHFHELQAQALEPTKILQQLSSGNLVVPPVRAIPSYMDTPTKPDLQSLSNAVKSDLRGIREAANIRVKLGQFKKYCDTMCSLGEWDRALSVAPAIGLDYWRSLVRRYAKRVQTDPELKQNQELSNSLVALLLAAGEVNGAVDQCMDTGDMETAYLLAASADAGSFDSTDPTKLRLGSLSLSKDNSGELKAPTSLPPLAIPNGFTSTPGTTSSRKEAMKKVAAAGYDQQKGPSDAIPTPSAIKMGATWKLTAGDVQGAFETLLEGGELDHALGLATVFGMNDEKRSLMKRIEAMAIGRAVHALSGKL